MNTIDLIIFIAYCLLILCVGLFVSRGRKGDERDAGDYFLAGRGLAFLKEVCDNTCLPVYAIGGMTPDRLPGVLEAGAKGACMMSGFMKL